MFSSSKVQRRSRADLGTITSVESFNENRSVSTLLHRIDCLGGTRTGDRKSIPAQDVSEVPSGVRLDFSSLSGLPNITTVDIDYCHRIETIIATLNTMTGLKEVKFYYCFPHETILQEIDNASLIEIAIHSHQPWPDADQLVGKTRERLPKCTITLTND